MLNYAIIAAGGSGKRFGGDVPKQFHYLESKKMVLDYSLTAFQKNNLTDRIVIALPPTFIHEYEDYLRYKYPKIFAIANSGETRQKSIINCLNNISENDALVLIHDSARPFVNQRIINECYTALKKSPCCMTAIQNQDTLYKKNDNNILYIPERSAYYMAQTPQGFHFSVLKNILNSLSEKADFTDEISLIANMKNISIQIVNGSLLNFKITSIEDYKNALNISQIIDTIPEN
jgi:2-C-methyl-D-erythritol 4-phosphate cytidylyltransferase